MANFFKNPTELLAWVKTQNENAAEASAKLKQVVGSTNENDITETTRRIFEGNNPDHAAQVLFTILSQFEITENNIKTATTEVERIKAADLLLKGNKITAEQHAGLVKEAQIMRQPGEYPMRLRVCPKLPMSVGGRLISTYNCRHYCLDSIVLDDDPDGVYCAEALWRHHVMDKFSREWKDKKTGQWVGGYINNRFHVFPQAGTPANPDVPRDGGNRMELKPFERTREARPHEYSMERRLQEQRKPGSTEPIKLASASDILISQANAAGMIKLASNDNANPSNPKKAEIAAVFTEAVELLNQNVPDEVASVKLAKNHSLKIDEIVRIQEMAKRKLFKHMSDVYTMKKEADMAQGIKYDPEQDNRLIQLGPENFAILPDDIEDPNQLTSENINQLPKITLNLQAQQRLVAQDDLNQGAQDVGLTTGNMPPEPLVSPAATTTPVPANAAKQF